jgi:hypothetical protein
MLVWALARLGRRPHDAWLDGFCEAVQQRLGGLAGGGHPQVFTNIVWALSSWEYDPGTIWLQARIAVE